MKFENLFELYLKNEKFSGKGFKHLIRKFELINILNGWYRIKKYEGLPPLISDEWR